MLISENTSNVLHAVYEVPNGDSSQIQTNIIVLKWIVFIGLCKTISLFGVGTNIINIICFIRQGFKDPINISLLGMAVSDLLSLTLLLWTALCFSPAFNSLDLPFEPVEVQYLITGMPHVPFSTITAWITALITLERCLCITSPLKVKTLITPKRVSAIVLSVFIILMSCQAPVFVVNSLGMKYFPNKNKTLIGLLKTQNGHQIESVSYVVNSTFLPFSAFLLIIVCTVTLVVQLRLQTKWRTKSTSSSNSESVSNRNKKVARMVIMISTFFISCFTPICFVFIVMLVVPGFTFSGKYREYLYIMSGFGNSLEAVNASSNIFIYFNMSSKYKKTFKQLVFRKDTI